MKETIGANRCFPLLHVPQYFLWLVVGGGRGAADKLPVKRKVDWMLERSIVWPALSATGRLDYWIRLLHCWSTLLGPVDHGSYLSVVRFWWFSAFSCLFSAHGRKFFGAGEKPDSSQVLNAQPSPGNFPLVDLILSGRKELPEVL